MSVYEKPRREKEEEKEKEEVTKWLDDLEVEEVKPIAKTETKTETKVETKPEEIKIVIKEKHAEVVKETVKTPEIEFMEIIPSWTNKPWMYIQPVVEGQLNSWRDSWISLILDYSRIFTEHIVNVNELLKKHPFTHQQTHKSLTQPVMVQIFDVMVTNGQAKWMDSNKILVRIYFKTDRQWADEIMEFLIEKGYAAELMTLFELENLNQEWSSIPRSELRAIFDLLVSDKRAKWVDNNKDSLTFKL